MPTMLQNREILRYDYPSYGLTVWDRDNKHAVDRINHGDIVVVVQEAPVHSAMIRIMTASGKIGWVYYNAQRLLKIEHCSTLGEDL